MSGQGLQFLPMQRVPDKWDPVWFVKFCREVLANADTRNAIEGSGITITGQPGEPATVSTSADLTNLLLQEFVLASPSGFLSHERVLAGEGGVVDITDGGDNANITVGLVVNGVNLGKIQQLSNYGVLGNPVAGLGSVQNISPVVDKSVVHLNGALIEFDLIDSTYISDFAVAAKAAVAFKYDRGASWVSTSGALTAGVNTVYRRVLASGNVTKVSLLTAGGTGSAVVDVRKGSYAAFPTVASICAAAKPTISSGIKYEDSTLTGWTLAVTAGEILAFVVESTSTFTQLSIELEVTP